MKQNILYNFKTQGTFSEEEKTVINNALQALQSVSVSKQAILYRKSAKRKNRREIKFFF